ncbi:MAG TPA: hypothetical protein VG186_14110 [Solirubrobacteraceae bacterium]|nr:hypothetical protein [Solirubrobacteraceae bacterium]
MVAPRPAATSAATSAPTAATPSATIATAPAAPTPSQPLITILPAARRHGLFDWIPAALVRGQPAVWLSRVPASGDAPYTVTLMRLDQSLLTLHLHAGGSEPGGSGWRYGPAIGAHEEPSVVAAFNSAFREPYGAGGFLAYGRVGWPLKRGKASVVIYRDGGADIGRWHQGVPAPGRPVAAVRQNLGLLIDAGQIPPSVDTCIKICWGDPLHEQPVVARSGLGVTADGHLVWAAGHNLSVRALAQALASKGVVRAMELDINPAWVAGFLYRHHPGPATATALPLVPGQSPLSGPYLHPYFRDFFTVVARTGS